MRRNYTFVGAGPSLGVAYTGMALMAEGPQEVGIAIAVEEFHHGLHIATVAPDDVVVLIAPTGAASRRCLDTAKSVHAWGAQLIAIVDTQDGAICNLAGATLELPDAPEPMTPLLTLLPLHRLSIQLAEQKVASGHRRPNIGAIGAMYYTSWGIIIDDIVFPDGRTSMGVLGGGGMYPAAGMRIWSADVGILSNADADFDPES